MGREVHGSQMSKCQIRWVEYNTGQPTPDDNIAIGTVYYTRGYFKHEQSQRFSICAEHAKRLTERGMEHWVFEPLPDEDQSWRQD